MRRLVLLWGPLALWGGFLSFLASRPADDLPPIPWGFPGMDKLLHVAFYAPLGLLLQRALGLRGALWAVAAGAAIGSGWGMFDEWLQSHAPGRESGWGDVIADAAGAGVAAWAAWKLRLGHGVRRDVGYH